MHPSRDCVPLSFASIRKGFNFAAGASLVDRFLIIAMPTSGVHSNEPLNILPTEAAKELREYAETRCLLYARELKKRRHMHDETDGSDANRHYDSFKEKCEGFLSERTCKDIKSMLKCAGCYIAKMKKSEKSRWFWSYKGYPSEAEHERKKMENYCQDVIGKREISATLAKNIKKLGEAAAWLAAYSVFGSEEEKMGSEDQLNTDFERIHGDVKLVNMNFITNEAKILSQRPLIISEREFKNDGDVEQIMTFSLSVTEGKTSSTTHTVNFSYGIGATFSAGFPSVGEINCQLSFDFSHNHSFNECISRAITKSYEFPLTVPAHDTYIAKATVYEAKMEIPYELVFDFGGGHRSARGVWKGVVCSKARYDVERVAGPEIEPEPYLCKIF